MTFKNNYKLMYVDEGWSTFWVIYILFCLYVLLYEGNTILNTMMLLKFVHMLYAIAK